MISHSGTFGILWQRPLLGVVMLRLKIGLHCEVVKPGNKLLVDLKGCGARTMGVKGWRETARELL